MPAGTPPEGFAYGDHDAQRCELFAPPGDGPFPVAVLLHGGFWRARYDRSLQWRLAEDLAARGWAAWNVEYRRLGDGGGWPHTLDDVGRAVEALAQPRLESRLDRSRVVAIGHSAGGQLAFWAAARTAGVRVPVTAVVAQAGALDLHGLWDARASDGVVRELLGGTPEEVPERYAQASPRCRLPVGVPSLLVHGEHDGDVPVAMSRAFAEAARDSGDSCDLVVVGDEGHYEHLDPGSACWRAVVQWLA